MTRPQRAGEETAGGGEEAALDDSAATEAAGVPEPVEVEIEETLSRTQVISRLKAIVLELEGTSLVVGVCRWASWPSRWISSSSTPTQRVRGNSKSS